MKKHQAQIRLADTDSAGRIYFASAFRIAHESFEAFLAGAGFPLKDMLAGKAIGLPVVHASADYREPIELGDDVVIHSSVASIGKSSISFHHEIRKGKSVAVKIKMTHVAVSNETGRAVKLPDQLRRKLSRS